MTIQASGQLEFSLNSHERIKTQSNLILAHLRLGKSITSLEALDRFRCFRLAARIGELRAAGHAIKTTRAQTESGATVAEYSLRASDD
jgi:hypothetical protein